MWKCEKCREYWHGTVNACNCRPFKVLDEEGDEREVHARSDKDAALKYAEESNIENDYYLMNDSVVIQVEGKKFKISAEPDVHYSANNID